MFRRCGRTTATYIKYEINRHLVDAKKRALLTNQGCLELIAGSLAALEIDSTIEEDKATALYLFTTGSFDIVMGLPCPEISAMKGLKRETLVIAVSSWLLDPWARPHLKRIVRSFDCHLILPYSFSEIVAAIERGSAVCGRQDIRSHIIRVVGRRMCRRESWPTCQRFNGSGELVRVY